MRPRMVAMAQSSRLTASTAGRMPLNLGVGEFSAKI
jgi:hypothetical protein